MTCSPGISPNGSPLQKSPLPDSSTPQPALGFLTISLHTIDHQPRGAITFAHNGCRKLRAYAYDSSCLTELKQPPLSPFELKAGWSIPAALECGLNSDFPGQTCARVTENVYDTATGRYLLIPQGTKVIGTYDSQIAYGQQRILVVWNRLIFPDASSLNLNGMPGEDKAGNAGFDAHVNNHYLKVFGSALLMAAFSAGIELTQKQ